MLTGGIDPDPALYGESPQLEAGEADRARDDYEIALVRSAISADMPVLAICRGMQLLNVAPVCAVDPNDGVIEGVSLAGCRFVTGVHGIRKR